MVGRMPGCPGAPAKRKEIESEVIALRVQLRDAILDGPERIHREELKKTAG